MDWEINHSIIMKRGSWYCILSISCCNCRLSCIQHQYFLLLWFTSTYWCSCCFC